ncbi:Retrovirus-related Pol polyprotein from transposon TNT 1-94 [Symbiodinium microadriaticum]|uniref:Retrovirus-related Pol polyprotein from transposon TNT 1-94 n=1 Tax=Symbiodinium microadriaticum TaxID=2951 RepID=A0A1Q9F6X3_SYMMI|nr:Retrovirus-related Pol polyprotein from transposon TNT 1-94 [Symbiodinium microadriaticum]
MMIDPSIMAPDTWPFRSTLMRRNERVPWLVVEHCAKWLELEDVEEDIPGGGEAELIVVLHGQHEPLDAAGIEVSDELMGEVTVKLRSRQRGRQSQPMMQMSLPMISWLRVLPDMEEAAAAAPGAAESERESVTVDGVELSYASPLQVLKAACEKLGLRTSGSKSPLFERVRVYLDKQKLSLEHDIARDAQSVESRQPRMQTLPKPPSPQEQLIHELSLPDRAETITSGPRDIATVSFDFFYTGYEPEKNELIEARPATEEDAKDLLCCLIAHDSVTGSVLAVPTPSKGATRHLGVELMRCVQSLGHAAVELRCDQEPATIKLQKAVVNARLRLGLKTTERNPPIAFHQSNGAVEKQVDLVRRLACTFLDLLRSKTGCQIGSSHPLFAWSFVHAAWIRNRFAVTGGLTAYEWTANAAYTGRLVTYGEPVFCYVVPRRKGNPKWVKAMFLTKATTSDMYVLGTKGGIRLSRAVRRTGQDWRLDAPLFDSVAGFPWDYSVVGTRLVPPAKGRKAIAADDAPAGFQEASRDEAGSDPPDTPIPRKKLWSDRPPPASARVNPEMSMPSPAVLGPNPSLSSYLGPQTPEASLAPLEPMTGVTEEAAPAGDERATKAPRIRTVTFGTHSYDINDEGFEADFEELADPQMFERLTHGWSDDEVVAASDHGPDSAMMDEAGHAAAAESLWFRDEGSEPSLSPEELSALDRQTRPEIRWGIAAIDVKDAYLEVPQESPVVADLPADYTGQGRYVFLRCVPGQRNGSQRWYDYYTGYMKGEFNLETCLENPAVMHVPQGPMLLHADDELCLAPVDWLRETFIPKLQQRFEISFEIACEVGDSFTFLKRKHTILEQGILVQTPEVYIHQMANILGIKHASKQNTPYTPELIKEDRTKPLCSADASKFRSALGVALYMSNDRIDVCFIVRVLAGFMANPTELAMRGLVRLVKYCMCTIDFATIISPKLPGSTVFRSSEDTGVHCLEVYSDADWSGHRVTRKSYGSATFAIDGGVVYHMCRSHRTVSMSSTESEWYAAISASCEGIFLKAIYKFMSQEQCELQLKVDNSATRQLAQRRGVGRTRHIEGRLLWLQQAVREHVLSVLPVHTMSNLGDLSTKMHSAARLRSLLYLHGFVDGCTVQAVGEQEYDEMILKANVKEQIKAVQRVAKQSNSMMTMSMAKRVALVTLFMLPNCAEAALTTSGRNTSFLSWFMGFPLCATVGMILLIIRALSIDILSFRVHWEVDKASPGVDGYVANVFIGMWIAFEFLQSFAAEHYFVALAMTMLFMMWKENRELEAIVSEANALDNTFIQAKDRPGQEDESDMELTAELRNLSVTQQRSLRENLANASSAVMSGLLAANQTSADNDPKYLEDLSRGLSHTEAFVRHRSRLRAIQHEMEHGDVSLQPRATQLQGFTWTQEEVDGCLTMEHFLNYLETRGVNPAGAPPETPGTASKSAGAPPPPSSAPTGADENRSTSTRQNPASSDPRTTTMSNDETLGTLGTPSATGKAPGAPPSGASPEMPSSTGTSSTTAPTTTAAGRPVDLPEQEDPPEGHSSASTVTSEPAEGRGGFFFKKVHRLMTNVIGDPYASHVSADYMSATAGIFLARAGNFDAHAERGLVSQSQKWRRTLKSRRLKSPSLEESTVMLLELWVILLKEAVPREVDPGEVSREPWASIRAPPRPGGIAHLRGPSSRAAAFVAEEDGMRDLHSLLCSSKTAELKLLVGIKEMRIQHERDACQVRSYAEMCDQVEALHQNSWCSSRKLRLCSTEEGDRKAANAILSLF